MTRILVVFDTRYGSTMNLAFHVAEGVKGVEGAEPVTRRVADREAVEEIVKDNERRERAMAQLQPIREVTHDDLRQADGIICGSPTRFGSMTAAMKAFWDSTGPLWAKGELAGKVGAAFSTTSTPHGGNEMTLFSLIVPMMHHGMLIAAPGYVHPSSWHASSPYGLTWVAGLGSDHDPDEATCRLARDLGERVATFATRLAGRKALHEVL